MKERCEGKADFDENDAINTDLSDYPADLVIRPRDPKALIGVMFCAEQKPIVITTNRPFSEWGEVFPNAPCVISIIDRLVHHSEIQSIDADSYRMHEATKRASKKQARQPTAKKS